MSFGNGIMVVPQVPYIQLKRKLCKEAVKNHTALSLMEAGLGVVLVRQLATDEGKEEPGKAVRGCS